MATRAAPYETRRVPLVPSLVALELGLAALIIGLGRGLVATVVGIGLLALIAVLVLVPWRGRPLWLTLVDRWALGRRLRAAARATPSAATGGHGAAIDPLRLLVPGLELVPAQDRKGDATALVSDGTGWTTVLGVESDEDVLAADAPALAVDDLFRLLQVDDITLASVQAVVVTVPAPTAVAMSADSPALASYAMHRVPAVRRTVVALRLDPQRCAPAIAARGGHQVGVNRALRRCAEAASELLGDPDGHRLRWLDADECGRVFALSAATPEGSVGGTQESWDRVLLAGNVHASATVTRLPDDLGAALVGLLDAMARAPALATALSITVSVAPPERRIVEVIARATGEDERQARAGLDFLVRAATARGTRLRRLDGEQAAGLVGTVPLGRGLSATPIGGGS